MCAQVWGLRDQVMCGIGRTQLRSDACALVPKLHRAHKQQLSVGDGGEGGTTRFIHYFFYFCFNCKSSLRGAVAVTDSRNHFFVITKHVWQSHARKYSAEPKHLGT